MFPDQLFSSECIYIDERFFADNDTASCFLILWASSRLRWRRVIFYITPTTSSHAQERRLISTFWVDTSVLAITVR